MSHKVGQLVSYWILPINGTPIACVIVQRLTNLEQQTQDCIQRMNEFTSCINKRLAIKDPHVKEFTSVIKPNKKYLRSMMKNSSQSIAT